MSTLKTLTVNDKTYTVVPVVPAASVTLLAAAWVGSERSYSQVVELAGVTSHTKVDLQPTPEQDAIFYHKALAFVAENEDGVVTVYSIGDKPQNDYTIQVTLTEVDHEGAIRGNTVGLPNPQADWDQDDPTKADYIKNKPAVLDGKSAYQYARDGGYTGTEEEFAEKLAASSGYPAPCVMDYGAKGDGSTNDTKAFQDTLAENRVVFVPGGTYVLSDTLVIRENCCLELSQDTILQFTKTSGNCIEMRGSAVLRGNHGMISVPYAFTGNVISMDTLLDGNNHASIPPYTKADPQWKRQRFVYDVNIVKPNSAGFNRPQDDGKCNGTAIYASATNVSNDSTDIAFMWGVTMSGIRIAGGFSYGIHAVNYDSADGSAGHYADDAWNHDMRIEAVIEGCEIGVALENCNGAHLNVTVQPNTTVGGTKYAKQGICLKDSRFVDMLRSRVWDWHVGRNDSEEYKHIALYGNCRGLLLDDFLVTEHPDTDIRDDIYTDTPSNFDTMTILQEPANKWFKSVDGVPYFNDGIANRKLMLASEKITAEQVEFITPADGYYTYEPRFTNLAKNCTDGAYLLPNGTTTGFNNYTTTDFIAIDPTVMHTYRIGGDGIVWKDNSGYGRIAWYDADKNIIGMTMSWDKVGTNIYYPAWVEDDTVESAFITLTTQTAPSKAHYFRISTQGKGEDLIVTIDEKQEYEAVWHGEPKRLDDSIKVKAENVVGLEGGDIPFYVNISAEDGYTCPTQVSTLEAILETGRLVMAKIITDTGALFAPICSAETSSDGRIVTFALNALTLTLTPTVSGYYEVTVPEV